MICAPYCAPLYYFIKVYIISCGFNFFCECELPCATTVYPDINDTANICWNLYIALYDSRNPCSA